MSVQLEEWKNEAEEKERNTEGGVDDKHSLFPTRLCEKVKEGTTIPNRRDDAAAERRRGGVKEEESCSVCARTQKQPVWSACLSVFRVKSLSACFLLL